MFTTAISMRCDELQFEVVRPKLIKLGYKIDMMSPFESDTYLTNNLSDVLGDASNIEYTSKNAYGRTSFDVWDEKFFLAMAAMTDRKLGIKGEWWKFTSMKNAFTPNKLYQQRNNDVTEYSSFIDDSGSPNGYVEGNIENFKKATLDEFIALYSKQYGGNKIYKI